jgi:hypothetical protein
MMTEDELITLCDSLTEAMRVVCLTTADTELAKRGIVLSSDSLENNMIKYAIVDGIDQAASTMIEAAWKSFRETNPDCKD